MDIAELKARVKLKKRNADNAKFQALGYGDKETYSFQHGISEMCKDILKLITKLETGSCYPNKYKKV